MTMAKDSRWGKEIQAQIEEVISTAAKTLPISFVFVIKNCFNVLFQNSENMRMFLGFILHNSIAIMFCLIL